MKHTMDDKTGFESEFDLEHVLRASDWPNKDFQFSDEPGEHDPCYVIMPDRAMLELNHHNGLGVDVARARFIIEACNEKLQHLRDLDLGMRACLEAIMRTTFSGSEMGDEYRRGNEDAHATCARMAKSALTTP